MSGTIDRLTVDGAQTGADAPREWVGHVIVCGLGDIGLRTVEQLHLAGARVVVLDDHADERFARLTRGWGVPTLPRGAHLSEPFVDAGIAGAAAVVCTESSDLRTLETVLLVRDLRPDVRVVAHLDNPAVAHAVEEVTGAATVLDIASLFAPSVVEACLGRRVHDIDLAATRFVTTEAVAPRAASLRELYGSLAPLGVVSDADDELVVCPGRDLRGRGRRPRDAHRNPRTSSTAAGLAPHSGAAVELGHAGARAAARARHAWRQLAGATDRPLRIALALGFVLLVVSTLVLHFAYRAERRPREASAPQRRVLHGRDGRNGRFR